MENKEVDTPEKRDERIKAATRAIDAAINAVKAIGENKKTNSHMAKLMAIRADYGAMLWKSEYLSEVPGKRTKKE